MTNCCFLAWQRGSPITLLTKSKNRASIELTNVFLLELIFVHPGADRDVRLAYIRQKLRRGARIVKMTILSVKTQI